MESEDLSLDRISNLPSSIIENILCLVPIQEAARTSTLSKDWRYNWTKIPKLLFDEDDMFVESSDRFFEAIHQVLLLHQGPIFEFSLLTENEDGTFDEIDQMIFLLARNRDTLKKLTLRLPESCDHLHLPLSIYSFHQLTDLYFTGFSLGLGAPSTLSGFGNLTSLYVQGVILSKDSLLNLLSSCPLLKCFELVPSFDSFEAEITIIELFKCLPVIEHLTLDRWNMKCDRVQGKHPTASVHLRYFCLKSIFLFDDLGLKELGFVIKNSPNLEKIKLEIGIPEFGDPEFGDDGTKLVTLKDCSDVWLEHLKELEIVRFSGRKGEMEFVKLILAKSPVLMKVRIILKNRVTKDEELEIVRILLGSPCVSSLAEMIVDCQAIS